MGKIIRRLLLALLIVIVVLNWTWGRLPKQPGAPAGAKYAQVGDTRIHYQEHAGADPAVVMVHGLPGVWGNWDPVVPKLAGRHTIVIDRPGYGFSSGDYIPLDEQVRTIHAFTQKLGLKRPVIAGFSYGGTLALRYAELYPAQTKSIVLVDAAAYPSDGSSFERAQAHAVKFFELPVIKQVWNVTAGQLFKTAAAKSGTAQAFDPQPADPAFEQQVLDYNMQSDDLKAYADEEINFPDAVKPTQAGLSKIAVPAYILQGKQDKMVDPSTATKLSHTLPNVKATVFVPGGHAQPFENPAAVAAQIKAAAR